MMQWRVRPCKHQHQFCHFVSLTQWLERERERERDCVCVGGTGARASAGHWRLRGVREQSVGRLLVDGRHASHVTSAACQPGRRARASHCWGRPITARARRPAEPHPHVLMAQTQRLQSEGLRTRDSHQYVALVNDDARKWPPISSLCKQIQWQQRA